MTKKRTHRLWLDARPGIKAPNAKLTDDQVREIRRLHAALPDKPGRGKAGVRELAARYGVSVSLVSKIALGRAWRHVREIA